MQYKAIIVDRKHYYEATSYFQRKNDSESWKKLGEPKDDSLEKTVLNSILKIAGSKGKKRTRVIVDID